MRTGIILCSTLLVLLLAGALTPAAQSAQPALTISSLVVAIITLLFALAGRRNAAPQKIATPEPATPPQAKPVPPPAPTPQPTAEAEILAFLGILQEKGRLVDFLMDDITPYDDAQVGTAARVVHQGCKAALSEYLQIAPIATVQEGQAITVPAATNEYRLTGRVTGSAPFSGTLVHKGWKAATIQLPRVTQPTGASREAARVIAPAEVEIR